MKGIVKMLEINRKQLLSFDEINRAKILKYIALGVIKYRETTEIEKMISENMDHIPRLD